MYSTVKNNLDSEGVEESNGAYEVIENKCKWFRTPKQCKDLQS